MAAKAQHPEANVHPSQSMVDRFPLDTLLRRHGWHIALRPREGEAVWEKGGERRPQSEALATLPAPEWARAEHAAETFGGHEGF